MDWKSIWALVQVTNSLLFDSLQFLSSSLDRLDKNLNKDDFEYLSRIW